MGKGDRKTAKGKRYNSSYGKSRPKTAGTPAPVTTSSVVKKATKTTRTVAKAPAKKAVAKKAVAKG